MPSKKFTTKAGAKLLVRWNILMTKTEVLIDEKPFAEIVGSKDMSDGKTLTLPDGSSLSVRFRSTVLGSRLEVEQDGKPLSGSTHDPVWRVKQAEQTLWIVGAVTLAVGIASFLELLPVEYDFGSGWVSSTVGIVFLVLAYFARLKKRWAVTTGLVIYAIDFVLTLVSLGEGSGFGAGSLIMHLIFLYFLYTGWQSFNKVKENSVTKM